MQPYGEKGDPNIPTAAAYGYGNAAQQIDDPSNDTILLKYKRELQEERNLRIKRIVTLAIVALVVGGTLTGAWVFLGPPATLAFASIFFVGLLMAYRIHKKNKLL